LPIANNLLAPYTKATNARISPWATTKLIWNNSKNLEDGSSGTKHLERYSYTIPKNPPQDQWGAVAKAWANKILTMTKMCLG